jgi:uncharacterized protein (TIGR01244 family)
MSDRLTLNADLTVGMDQPGAVDLEVLARDGFRSVVNLRQAGETGETLSPEAEGDAVRRKGMRYRHIPVSADRLDAEVLERFHREMSHLPKPIFVHCASGKRSGTLALLHLALAEGWSGDEMLGRAEALGIDYGPEELRDCLRGYIDQRTGRHRASPSQAGGWRSIGASVAATLPDTAARVPEHTPAAINERIRRQAEDRVRYCATHPHEISERLQALDREWDIERALEANAASLALAGVALGAFLDRRFLILPALVTGFLFQHALQGWCPPLTFFRKRGFRTAAEIDQERYALKALRSDFTATPAGADRARAAL